MSVLKSLRSVSSQLYSTSSTHTVQWSHTNQASIWLHFSSCFHHTLLHTVFSFFHYLISFYFLVFLHVFYLLPFFSSPLANLIPFPFLLSSPLLSSFSHAPVGEYNEMAMAVLWCVRACVFLCDVTLCRSIVALSFLIPVLRDHTAILRFYKPFQRSFKGNACPCTVYWVCVFGKKDWGKECVGMFVCVCAYFSVRAADNSTLSSYMVHVKIIMSNMDLICLIEKQKSDC